MTKPLFKFSWDETGLSSFLTQVDEHLSRHDEEIAELRQLLHSRPTYSDIDRLRDDLRRESDQRFSDQQSKFDQLSHVLDEVNQSAQAMKSQLGDLTKTLSSFEQQFSDKLSSATAQLRDEMATAKSDVLHSLPRDPTLQINDLNGRLRLLETKSEGTAHGLRLANEHLRTVANSIALLNDTTTRLDGSLQETLGTATRKVRDDVRNLFDLVGGMKADVERLQPRSPRPTADADLLQLMLRPDAVADWRDPPELPRQRKFSKVSQVVDYDYEMVPKLQGYLNAMHDRLIETADTYPPRAEVQGVIDDLVKRIEECDREVAGLRRAVARMVTRAEFAAFAKRMSDTDDPDGNTSIGRVKCIACGRDVIQITGAMTEREAMRQLGPAPTSLATGPRGMGQIFANAAALDASLVESPRSVRAFKAGLSVRRKRKEFDTV
jgi:gas vesicle protein